MSIQTQYLKSNQFALNPYMTARGATKPIIFEKVEPKLAEIRLFASVNEHGNSSIILKPDKNLIRCCQHPELKFDYQDSDTGLYVLKCENCGAKYLAPFKEYYESNNVAKILKRETEILYGHKAVLRDIEHSTTKYLIPEYPDHTLRIPIIFNEDNLQPTKNLAVFLYRTIVNIISDKRVSRKITPLEIKWEEEYDNLMCWSGKTHQDMLKYAQTFDEYDEESVMELIGLFANTFLQTVV